MVQNRVLVKLEGQDELSDDLRRLSKAVAQLGKDFSKTSIASGKSFGGLENAIRGSIIQVGLLGSAVTGAMSLAQTAIGNAVSGYQALQQTQQSIIYDTDALSEILNTSFDETWGLLREERIELQALAVEFGVTGDYATKIFNNVKDDVARIAAYTGDSFDDLAGRAQRASVAIAAVGESAGLQAEDINKLLTRFLSGSITEGELRTYAINDDPKFRNAINAAVAGSGLDSINELKQLTLEERWEFYERLGSELEISSDALKATQNLANTQLGKFNLALFGENGLFSFTREIEAIKGNQTLFDVLNQLGVSLFAEDGLFYAIGNAFTRLTGLDADDLVAGIYKGFVRIDNFLYKLTNFFNRLERFEFDDVFRDIPYKIAVFLNSITSGFDNLDLSGARNSIVDVINNILGGIASVDFTPFFANVGALLGEVVDEGIKGLAAIDWSTVGAILLKALGHTVAAVGAFLQNISPEVYLATGIATISAGMVVLMGQVVVALAAPLLATVGTAVAAAIGGVALLPALLVGGLVLIVTGLIALIVKNWEGIKEWFNNLFTTIGEAIADGTVWLLGQLHGFWGEVRSRFSGVFEAFTRIIDWVKDAGGRFLSLLLGDSGGSIAASTSGKGSGSGRITNRADGFVDGLVAAAIREQRMSPPNTGLYVGNTSEMVLTRQDQTSLNKALSNRRSLESVNFGDLHVYSQASDPKQVAKEVMREIEYRFAQYRSSQLAASVD